MVYERPDPTSQVPSLRDGLTTTFPWSLVGRWQLWLYKESLPVTFKKKKSLFYQAFREEIAPINLKVKTMNDLSSQLSPLDLHPSLKMSRQLDDLNMRWKLLQVPA